MASTLLTKIRHVYVQTDSTGKIEEEHKAVRNYLAKSYGVTSSSFTLQEGDEYHDFPSAEQLGPSTLVVGDHTAIRLALDRMGVSIDSLDSYPESLHTFLQRPVRQRTLKQVKQTLNQSSRCYTGCQRVSPSNGIFVKPVHDTKAFTGTVLCDASDLHLLGSEVTNKTKLWVSPAVDFITEYRVFVLYGEIVGVQHYSGDFSRSIDVDIVRDAIVTLEGSYDDEGTAAYALDFGLLSPQTTRQPMLDSNESSSNTPREASTVLVEWNDAYALGCYGLDPAAYTKMLVARWLQLSCKRKCGSEDES